MAQARVRSLVLQHIVGESGDDVPPELEAENMTVGQVFTKGNDGTYYWLGQWIGALPNVDYLPDDHTTQQQPQQQQPIELPKPKLAVEKLVSLKKAGFTTDDIIEMHQHGLV